MHLSGYRFMWLVVLFDLPVDTRRARREYARFRKALLKDGFTRMQYSVYVRHCASQENAAVHAQRVKRIGAWLLQADPARVRLSGGSVVGDGGSVALREIARAWYLTPQHLPPDVNTGGLEVTAGYKPDRDAGTFSYASHAAVVAVDPATGAIEILDYAVCEDGGRLVNPMIVDGQITGGTAQGIGTALYEAMPFDAHGQPQASTLADYLLPGACEVPNIRVLHMETPSPHTAFGVKGIGEGGAVGPPAAIVSAVNDALRGVGAEVHDLPLTPRRILAALEGRIA